MLETVGLVIVVGAVCSLLVVQVKSGCFSSSDLLHKAGLQNEREHYNEKPNCKKGKKICLENNFEAIKIETY